MSEVLSIELQDSKKTHDGVLDQPTGLYPLPDYQPPKPPRSVSMAELSSMLSQVKVANETAVSEAHEETTKEFGLPREDGSHRRVKIIGTAAGIALAAAAIAALAYTNHHKNK